MNVLAQPLEEEKKGLIGKRMKRDEGKTST